MSRSIAQTGRLLMCAVGLAVAPARALAVELFGVHVPGTPSPAEELIADGQLAYSVELAVADGSEDLKQVLTDASLLITQAKSGAPDVPSLVARARADRERLTAALYSEARYGGVISIEIGGVPLESAGYDRPHIEPGQVVEVAVKIAPGPVFTFGRLHFSPQQVPGASGPMSLTPSDYGLIAGAPAKSALLVAVTEKLVEVWRSAGYPLARIASKDISANHATSQVDADIMVDPGAPAVYGWINVTGAKDLDPETVAAQSKLNPGDRYNPSDLNATRKRLSGLESVESVRIIQGERIDEKGRIPITLEVTERKPRYVGATASVSSIDGAEVQAFWGHRNLFGGAERLRLDATVSQIGVEDISQLQFDAGAVFAKPGVLDVDTDLFSEFRLKRENPDTYESLSATSRTGLSHRFSPALSGSLAAKVSYERVEDALGTNRYTTLALPGDLVFDNRDNRLDPAGGLHARVYLSPTASLNGGGGFVKSEGSVATYHSVDDGGRVVLAGQVFAGSVFGADLADVPATSRYYAGGGGSVRGFQYQSLGPEIGGSVVGGLSMVRASAELRLRVTDSFGIVPFVDVAHVSSGSSFQFSDTPFVGAGMGLRYYTALGPLRLDVAAPVTHRDGQPSAGFYLGLGQAF